MYTPVVLGVAVLFYGVSCIRAWNKITKFEDSEKAGQ